MKVPNGHQTIMPYLIVPGAAKFIEFTQKVFNAAETFRAMREDGKMIMHAELQIGSSTIMCADSTDQIKPQLAGLFVYVENADDTYKKAVEEGGTTIMELSDKEYGRTCGVSDPVGITWWITSIN